MDTSGNGRLSRAEMIKAARTDPKVRQLLDLPATIRQEDGSRDRFERVFQAIDRDDSKEIDYAEFAQFVAQLRRVGSSSADPGTKQLGTTKTSAKEIEGTEHGEKSCGATATNDSKVTQV